MKSIQNQCNQCPMLTKEPLAEVLVMYFDLFLRYTNNHSARRFSRNKNKKLVIVYSYIDILYVYVKNVNVRCGQDLSRRPPYYLPHRTHCLSNRPVFNYYSRIGFAE